jgi:2-keto-3-deoxy-L-rhamnonate aldolase RhmA
MVIAQFEIAEAVERAEKIVAVEDIDIVLIGTNDLTADLGFLLAAAAEGARQVRTGGLVSRRPEARGAAAPIV